jgi:hypothetical protein
MEEEMDSEEVFVAVPLWERLRLSDAVGEPVRLSDGVSVTL